MDAVREQNPEPDAEADGLERSTWLFEEGLGEPMPEPVRLTELDLWIDRRGAKMAELEAQIERERDVMERRVRMIRDHFEGVIAALERQRTWLEQQLVATAEGYPYPKGKKSRDLPFVTIGKRASRESLDVEDADAALAFAEETDGLREQISVKRWVNKTPLLDYFQATGEVPPGCVYVAAEDRPYVKVKGGV